MTTHRCPGLVSTNLMTYLAALGLARVLTRRSEDVGSSDPDARFGWQGKEFVVTTSVDDLVEYLIGNYVPTPIVSPWNGGSGFGAKDKTPKKYLDLLLGSDGERLATYRATIASAQEVVARAPAADSGHQPWPKGRLVQELRNSLPDSAIEWFDATVVLGVDLASPAFPPIMGTGGNDGRLDYSSNFHQRLADVLPELGASEKQSRAWAHDLLEGAFTTKLVSAAIGQADALGAGGPNSSIFGSADFRVNPWAFVLMAEGVMWFASGASRRLGETRGRASMPFTVQFSPEGPRAAAPEENRGELWAPVFASIGAQRLRHVMSEARASWQGTTARRSVDMYGAVKTYGVDRGVDRFERFAFLQRNGLSYVAVHLDTVRVESIAEVSLARMPLRRGEAFSQGSGNATAIAARRFDRDIATFVRNPSPEALLAALAAQTNLEQQAWRSKSNRGTISPRAMGADAAEVCDYLHGERFFADNPEARVAAGLASGWRAKAGQYRGMRTLLLGADPAQHVPEGEAPASAAVTGLGTRPLHEVLADVVVWCAHHPQENARFARGFQVFNGHAYRTHWTDMHAWTAGLLDDSLVETYFMAFVSLVWPSRIAQPAPSGPNLVTLDPTLAVLQALASGWVVPTGVSNDSDTGRVGLSPDWPTRLRAGLIDGVLAEAASLVGRSRIVSRSITCAGPAGFQSANYTFLPRGPHGSTAAHGSRLLAAITGPASTGALRAVATRRDEEIKSLSNSEGAES